MDIIGITFDEFMQQKHRDRVIYGNSVETYENGVSRKGNRKVDVVVSTIIVSGWDELRCVYGSQGFLCAYMLVINSEDIILDYSFSSTLTFSPDPGQD